MYKLISLLAMSTTIPVFAQSYNADFLFMAEQANLAPSGHNSQPWLFKINDSGIEIHPDCTKTLPVVDPDNRELFISLGCALENLCIAASVKGYLSEVEISPEGIITVNLKYPGISVAHNTLFPEIVRRQTNRSEYTGRKIPADTLALLQNFVYDETIPARFYGNSTPEFYALKHFVQMGNSIQMTDKAFKQELKNWMRYNKKHSESTSDGLAYDAFGAPNLPRFMSKPAMGMALNEKRQIRTDNRKIDCSSHLILFTITENNITEWVLLGRHLQRFLLKTTQLGIANAYLNQPLEIHFLSEKISDSLQLDTEIPAILLRIGYADPLPRSRRRDISHSLL